MLQGSYELHVATKSGIVTSSPKTVGAVCEPSRVEVSHVDGDTYQLVSHDMWEFVFSGTFPTYGEMDGGPACSFRRLTLSSSSGYTLVEVDPSHLAIAMTTKSAPSDWGEFRYPAHTADGTAPVSFGTAIHPDLGFEGTFLYFNRLGGNVELLFGIRQSFALLHTNRYGTRILRCWKTYWT